LADDLGYLLARYWLEERLSIDNAKPDIVTGENAAGTCSAMEHT
jgi:hypothetical protein